METQIKSFNNFFLIPYFYEFLWIFDKEHFFSI